MSYTSDTYRRTGIGMQEAYGWNGERVKDTIWVCVLLTLSDMNDHSSLIAFSRLVQTIPIIM